MALGFAKAIADWVLANPGIIAVFVLLYVFIYFLSLMFQVPKAGPNPFKIDCKRKAEELVLEQKVRDKVLKQGG